MDDTIHCSGLMMLTCKCNILLPVLEISIPSCYQTNGIHNWMYFVFSVEVLYAFYPSYIYQNRVISIIMFNSAKKFCFNPFHADWIWFLSMFNSHHKLAFEVVLSLLTMGNRAPKAKTCSNTNWNTQTFYIHYSWYVMTHWS